MESSTILEEKAVKFMSPDNFQSADSLSNGRMDSPSPASSLLQTMGTNMSSNTLQIIEEAAEQRLVQEDSVTPDVIAYLPGPADQTRAVGTDRKPTAQEQCAGSQVQVQAATKA